MIVWNFHFDGKDNCFIKDFSAQLECKSRSHAEHGNEGISWTVGHSKSVPKDTDVTEFKRTSHGLLDHFLSCTEDYMKRHYPIIIEQDRDGVYIVECPSFKGCRSYGHNIEEAIENIEEAIEVCAEENIIEDQPIFIGVRDIELAIA